MGSSLRLLAEIREACGDNEKRMQPELVNYIGELYEIAKKVIDIDKRNTLNGVSKGVEELATHVKRVLEKEIKNEDHEINYAVCYKWQEGGELFFDRMVISDFEVKDKDFLDKIENRLRVILSNTGMEDENLATVQITGITRL